MTVMKRWIICLAGVVLVGCAPKGTYEVEVRNDSTRPITLWLNKVGPPPEEGWYTPEELVKMPIDQQRYDLAFVPPGRTGYTGKLKGQFPEGTTAVLRVYEGEKELHALAEAPASSRSDYALQPGKNELVVVDRLGRLVIEPAE